MIDKDQIAAWRVLVVDDEPDSVEVVSRVLSFYGATVLTASTGAEAIDLLQRMSPTLILSDLSMPNMDGWEMLHIVQQDGRTADIPIIALTAHTMDGDRERILRAGFHYYLSKPLKPGSFLKDLNRVFSENPNIARNLGYVPDPV